MMRFTTVLILFVLCASVTKTNGENQTNTTTQPTTTVSTTETTTACNVNSTTNINGTKVPACTTTMAPNTTTPIITTSKTTTIPATNANDPNITNNTVTITPTSVVVNQTTETETTSSNSTINAKTSTTGQTMNSTTTPAPSTNTTTPEATTSLNTTTLQNTTTQTTQTTTTVASTTTPPLTTIQDEGNDTTATTKQTIIDKIKDKWGTAVENLNLTNSSLNITDVEETLPSDVITALVTYFKEINTTDLKSKVEDSRVSEVADVILDNNPTLLDSDIRNRLNSSQNISVYGLFATLYWFRDEVLCNNAYFKLLAESYAPLSQPSGGEVNVTTIGFIQHTIAQSNGSSLLTAICNVAETENINASACSYTEPPTTAAKSLPGPEKMESTWKDIIAKNYTFLTVEQMDQLQSVTPENMTTAIIEYVNALSSDEVKALVEQNVTLYVSIVLRSDEGSSEETIGKEAFDAFSNDTDKEDLFYVYLSFLNNFVSNSDKFETFLKVYVESTAFGRNAAACDTSSINADGIICECITKEANNITVLIASICDELQAGTQCTDTVGVKYIDSTAVQHGLTTWEIVAIVLGSVFGFILLLIIIILIWKRCSRKKTKVNPQVDPGNSDVEMDNHRTPQGGSNGPSRNTNGTNSP